MRRAENFGSALHKAVSVQMRVLADLAWRSLTADGDMGTSYCAWTRRGMLVVVARGSQASALARVLPDVGIAPQSDRPDQIDPERRAWGPEAASTRKGTGS